MTRTLAALLVAAAALLPSDALRCQVVAYHDVSSASHQSQFTTLTGQGYRLRQLSVAGGLATARYSAIWEVAAGPAWVSAHGLTLAQYQSQRTTWLAQNFRPKLVTAAGTGADTVFAAMFVADGASFTDLWNATQSQFDAAVVAARNAGRRPVSVDIHGSSTTPLYCGAFEPNTTDTVWGVVVDDDSTAFAATYSAFLECDARLAALGMSESQRYVSVWHDDRVGAWVARYAYTNSGWQTQFNALTASGYSPLVIASGGSGSSLRFAGAFAAERTPRARSFSTTGQARAEFAAADAYMQNLMSAEGARNASIAIAKDGRLVFARGYTWAEAGQAQTQPTSNFRIASVTKVLTSLAVHHLDANSAALSLSSRPQQVLGLPATGGLFDTVDLRDCLEYTSGIRRDYSGHLAASWANPVGFTLPTTHTIAVNWLRTQPIEFTPGSYGEYSNAAFLLAAQVVRQQSGGSLQSYLQTHFYTPLGITRARVAASMASALVPGELKGYTTYLETFPSNVHTDRRRRAEQWSADMALADGSGGMSMSTVDCVRLLAGVFGLGVDGTVLPSTQQSSMLARHTFPEWQEGPGNVTPGSFSWWSRPNGVWAYNKSGTLSDSSTRAIWRSDGIAIAAFVNKGDAHPDLDQLNQIVEAVSNWPTDDLFPGYGLPSFPRRPALTSVNASSLPNVTNTPFVLTGERLDTVTRVNFGGVLVTATTAASWHDGWFRVLSPTQLEFYVPQGLAPGFRGLSVENAVGSSTGLFTSLFANAPGVLIAAPPTVAVGQPCRVYCGAGSESVASFAALGISTSTLPTSLPGIVDLAIGNQFTDLIIADLQPFDPVTRAVFWPIPPLPWLQAHVQCATYDPASATPFPLPTSPARTIVRM